MSESSVILESSKTNNEVQKQMDILIVGAILIIIYEWIQEQRTLKGVTKEQRDIAEHSKVLQENIKNAR